MGVRATEPELQKLLDDGKEVYSFSRLDNFNNCHYGFFLHYIKGLKDKENVYSSSGGRIHDVLQHYIDDGQDDTLEDEINNCLDDLELFGIEFPKDRNGGDTIKENWVANMTLFARHFQAPSGKFETEKFVLYKDKDKDIFLQGYIDLLRYNDDGTVSIFDWKTSSMYKNEDILKHSRQLTTYGLACEQLGLKVRDIAWVMLKYADYTKTYKNGSERQLTAEWRKVPEEYLDSAKVAIVSYPYNEETKEECRKYIRATVDKIRLYGNDENAYNPCSIAKSSYFCNQLCGVRDNCQYLADYNAQFVKENSDDDLF